MKLSEINRKKYALKILVYVLVGMLAMPVGGLPVAEAASCMDIADIPLESMEEEGPGLIMFVVDDSGSMDWSTMIDPLKESNGIFDNNYEYVFSNPGDDIYSTWNSVEDAGTDIKMKWMSQWSGYNGMYYDPTVRIHPWPCPTTRPPSESPANVDSPRSNPMVNDDTKRFDLSTNGTDWHTWDDEVGVLVDNGGHRICRFRQLGVSQQHQCRERFIQIFQWRYSHLLGHLDGHRSGPGHHIHCRGQLVQ